jgi:large subunit ribosomal protein L17
MRHRKQGRKLKRPTEHRIALLRNLATSLILHERIQTTLAKAKEAQRFAEHLITLAKRGDVHARRLAAGRLLKPEALKKLFSEIGARYQTRNGGYTRIYRLERRRGDGARLALLELVVRQGALNNAK